MLTAVQRRRRRHQIRLGGAPVGSFLSTAHPMVNAGGMVSASGPQPGHPGQGGSQPPGAGGVPAPPVVPPYHAPGHIQIPGMTDQFYANLLQNNPTYKQQLANLASAHVSNDAGRRQAIQRLLTNFGYIPRGFTDQYGDITDIVRRLAEANTGAGLSAFAQLNKQRDVGARDIKNDLASRGMLQSGDTGFQLGRNEQDYASSLSASEQALLDELTNSVSGYTQGETELGTARTDAASQAMQEILAENPSAPSDQAQLLAATQGSGGHGWYALGNTLYDETGKALDLQSMIARLQARRQAYLAAGHTRDQWRAGTGYQRLLALQKYYGMQNA